VLNFDEARFVRIQSAAVEHADGIGAFIDQSISRGTDTIVFAGVGGAGILMQPAHRLLATESRMPAFLEFPAELMLSGSKHLGPSSLVVIPSLSGTTPEGIAVVEYAKAAGATVMSMTGSPDSPIALASDKNFVVPAADDTSSESFYFQSLLVALAVQARLGEIEDAEDVVGQLRQLPALLVETKRSFENRAAQLAETIQAEDYHIFTSSGGSYAEAHYFGMCILEEMQWIRTRPIHAADFFHGTLELLEPGVSVFLLKGEDATRPLTDRVERFAREHTDRLRVIDAADFEMPGISPRVRRLISPVIHATVLERLAAHLEVKRDHPLTTRRYYRRVAY
jgi:fructoselysine-6-phosphate deglycase